LGRCGADCHPGPSEAAIEQDLHEQSPIRVPDQHRLLIEIADQLLVVVHDLLHPEARQRLGGLTELLDIALFAWPLRRGHGEAALAEVVGVVLPAPCREPRPVMKISGIWPFSVALMVPPSRSRRSALSYAMPGIRPRRGRGGQA